MESRRPKPNNNKYIEEEENDLPTEEEIYRVKRLRDNNNNESINNINSNQDNDIYLDDDIDENIVINQPNNYYSINLNNLHINNPNNINTITFHNRQNNNNNIKNNNNINNNNNNNNNIINNNNRNNNVNNIMESFLDEDGNVVYKNKVSEPELTKINSHRIKVGNNEFEDLTSEAREMQNKEAFEKKILGIYKNNEREIKPEKKPFLERVGDFIENHEDGILSVIDGIGCILLHGPSIVRTINRVDRWIDNIGNDSSNRSEQDNEVQNILNNVGLRAKEKDLNTILKFLPVWEVRENKRHDNNNNCVVCLCEFQIGDIISALPCCHVFHTECIEKWLKNELSCPVCKFEVTLSSIIGRNNN